MPVRFLPAMAFLSFFVSNECTKAGPQSVLRLEPDPPVIPFQQGDQIQIEFDADGVRQAVTRRVTVLQTEGWPWVLVRSDDPLKTVEWWINVVQIRQVRRISFQCVSGLSAR